MKIDNPESYLDSMRKLKRKVYVLGERCENTVDHPVIRPSTNSVSETYNRGEEPEAEELLFTESHLTGERISRFTHIHQSRDDLIKKVLMLRLLGRRTATCFQRCGGMDGLNALYSVTYECDRAEGTNYHERFRDYLEYIQQENLVVDAAMTDVKGDRSLRPTEQEDPDMYLHVVERSSEGMVVRGAKAHQTGALSSHEILVVPTAAMRENEADYAVAFAVPADSEGVTFVAGRQPSDTRKLEGSPLDTGNPLYGSQEALIIFDDVFVPSERVFLDGRPEYCGGVVERFAAFHRQSYGGCKTGAGDVLIGAAGLVAEYQGTGKASHIRDKITEMVHLNETMFCSGVACGALGAPAAGGGYMVDILLANVCKMHVTRCPFEIARLAQDIAGGLMVTMPSGKDFENPLIARYLEKYLKAGKGVPTIDRIKVLKFIENMTTGCGAAAYLTESIHGAGSPQAQRIMIARHSRLSDKVRLVKRIAGLEE